MEYVYIRNVTLQHVQLIKDAYGTLVWKTHFEELFRRVVSKTRLIKLINDAYATLVWKTSLEDLS